MRNRLQKQFAAWVKENKLPIKIESATYRGLTFSFTGIDRRLVGQIVNVGIEIAVYWNGRCIDYIRDVDNHCFKKDGKYYCGWCIEPTEAFDTKEQFLKEHVFADLREWMEEKLYASDYINVYLYDPTNPTESSSWAKLTKEGEHLTDSEHFVGHIKLRV